MDNDKQKLNDYMATATEAAKIAGAEALSQMDSIQCHLKNGDEVVTQADPICQELIIEHIRKRYPEHGIVAEEGTDGKLFKLPPTGDEDIWWIIDPIDGTNNYSHRVLSFSVSIGLFKDGMPLVGVIYIPASETMFSGIIGDGSYCDGRLAKCGTEDVNISESIAIDSYWDDGIPDKLMALIDASRLRNFGSTAIHLAYVAIGGFAGAVVNRNKLWDFAAGAAIIYAAGGKMTLHTGEDLLPIDVAAYQGGQFRYLAANPVAHKQLLESLN